MLSLEGAAGRTVDEKSDDDIDLSGSGTIQDVNSAAISLLAEAGIQGRKAEILLRRLLSELVTPSPAARRSIERLGVGVRDLDPSHRSIPEIVRRLADAGLDESSAAAIFGAEAAPAMLALIRRVDRLEKLQSP